MVTNSSTNTPTGASGTILRGQGVGTAPAFSTATYPSTAGSSGNVLTSDGTNWSSAAPAAGGVTGPGSSTDRAIATWNGTGGTALFNNSTAKIDSSGRMTNTSQPAFYAYLTSNATNTTGDATVVSVNSGTPYTIVTNQGSGLATTGIFTAPVTGFYFLGSNFQLNGTFTAITQITVRVKTTARTFEQDFNFTAGTWGANTGVQIAGAVPMTAGDTAYVQYSAQGSTKVVGVNGGDGNAYFYGYLIC